MTPFGGWEPISQVPADAGIYLTARNPPTVRSEVDQDCLLWTYAFPETQQAAVEAKEPPHLGLILQPQALI